MDAPVEGYVCAQSRILRDQQRKASFSAKRYKDEIINHIFHRFPQFMQVTKSVMLSSPERVCF